MERYLRVFVLSLLVWSGRALEGAQDCDYDTEIRTYFCKEIFDTFPEKFYGNYHLRCIDCHIAAFTNRTFPFTNNLVSFNVSESKIKYVTSGAFSSLSNAQYLYLDHNEIQEIHPMAFAGLRQVYELHLQHNRLVNLYPGFLSDLEANSVDLSHNKIRELPNGILEGSLGVLTLDLSHNGIHKIGEDALNGMDSLEFLNLENNKLCHLPLGVFKHLHTLRQLNLADNKLTKFAVGSFSGLKNLNSLNLANNSISMFDGNILLSFNHLSNLDISGNGIYYFDANGIHTSAPTLKVITIDDNPFSCTLLINIIQFFKSHHVDVVNKVGRYAVQNVNGIACSDMTIDQKIDFKMFLQMTVQDSKKYYIYC